MARVGRRKYRRGVTAETRRDESEPPEASSCDEVLTEVADNLEAHDLPTERALRVGSGPIPDGQTIGPYIVRSELARGGMGAVYRAYHPELERDVALKVLLAGPRAGPKELHRFKREAKSAARLRHPGVVSVHDVGEDQGVTYMVMDLIEGDSLQARLRASGPLAPRRAAELIRDLADAVGYAHSEAIVHRDIKPGNVLLSGPDDRPLLTDFGLAKDLIEEGITRTGAIVGTPAYMPPEQARGELDELDERADIYALGATLYETVSGTPVFRGQIAEVLHKVLNVDPTPLRDHGVRVERDLETICRKCLEKEADDRYPSARELSEDLSRYLRDEPIHALPPNPLARLRKWVRRKPAAAVALVAVALALALSATLLVQRARSERAKVAAKAAADRAKAGADQEKSAADEKLAAAERTLKRAAAAKAVKVSHQRDEVVAILDEARSGELARKPGGLDAAVFALVRNAAGADLLVAELDAVSEALREVGSGGAVDLAQPVSLGAQQFAVLGSGRLDAAQVSCEALGRIAERPGGTEAALIRYLASEADPLRAAPAAVVLCQLGGEQAVAAVHQARRRFGLTSSFAVRVRQALATVTVDAPFDATTPTGRFLRGEARLAQQNFEGARDDFTGVLANWPDHVGALCNRANALESLGDLQGALADLNRAIELQADDRLLYYCRALLFKHLDDAESARSDLDRTIELDPGYPEGWQSRGALRRDLRDYEGAATDLSKAIALNPSFLRAWTDRAETRIRMRQLDAAALDIEKAMKLDSNSVWAWHARGYLLLLRRDVAGALSALQQAIECDPKRFKVWERMAAARLQARDTPGAVDAYGNALRLNPRSVWSLSRRGALLSRLGKHHEAVDDFTRALEIEPDQFGCLANRGLTYQRLEDHQKAVADFERALKIDPRNLANLLNRGISLEALGRLKEALASYDQAIAVQEHPDFLYNRGLVRAKLGQTQGALADLERFLALAPNHPVAPQIRQVIAELTNAE